MTEDNIHIDIIVNIDKHSLFHPRKNISNICYTQISINMFSFARFSLCAYECECGALALHAQRTTPNQPL